MKGGSEIGFEFAPISLVVRCSWASGVR